MLIDYKKVDIYHKDGAPVLHDVNFHVDEGELYTSLDVSVQEKVPC